MKEMPRQGGVMLRMIGLLLLIMNVSLAKAAVPKHLTVDPVKKQKYISEGIFTGGSGATPVTMLNLRRQHSKKLGMERLVVDFGDSRGKPLKEGIGYVHVVVQKDPARIVVDFTQMQRSALDIKQLKNILAQSPYVKDVDLRYDPQDVATSMILQLKKAVMVEVFEMSPKGQKSRLVIDLKEPRRVTRKVKKASS